MDNYNIKNIPDTNLKHAGFREHMKSEFFNENNNQILYDILNLYNKSNILNREAQGLLEVIDIENTHLKNKILELYRKVESLESNSNSITKYPSSFTANNMYPALIDLEASDVTMTPSKITNKTVIIDEGSGYSFVPDQVILDMKPAKSAYQVKDMFEPKNCLNPYNNDIWLRKIYTSKTESKVTQDIIITLSEATVSNLSINEIVINPFPSNSLNIKNIYYKLNHESWQLVPYLNSHSQYVNGKLKDISKVRFTFPTIQANQIKIELEQEHFEVLSDKRLFHIGLKSVEINYNEYFEKENFFDFEIELPESGLAIEKIDVKYNNYNGVGDLVNFEYFYNDDNGFTHRVIDSMPFICPASRLSIRCKIFNKNLIPNLNKVTIFYKNN